MEFQVIILFNALEEFGFLFKVAGTSMKVTCKLELPAGAACGGSGLLLLKSVRARLPFSASVKTSAAADGAGTRTLGAARSLWAIPPDSTRRPDEGVSRTRLLIFSISFQTACKRLS
jgi:hypothetical protein